MQFLAASIAIGLAALGASFSDAILTSKTVESIARQPEAKDSLQTVMFIGVGLIESIPIIAAVIAFMLMSK